MDMIRTLAQELGIKTGQAEAAVQGKYDSVYRPLPKRSDRRIK